MVSTNDDIQVLAQIAQALWADGGVSEAMATETLATVSLQDLTPAKVIEKTSTGLLQRAMREGLSANSSVLHQPFFRMLPEERLVLVALHSGRWSYGRLSRVLGYSVEEIERIAWNARLHLASLPGAEAADTPIGSPKAGSRCPEYDVRRPWTQRFLDDEIGTQEHLFFQNHLMACDRCRSALNRCRKLYYAVDGMIPKPSEQSLALGQHLSRVGRHASGIVRPSERTFAESLVVFASRREVRWAVVIGIAMMIWLSR